MPPRAEGAHSLCWGGALPRPSGAEPISANLSLLLGVACQLPTRAFLDRFRIATTLIRCGSNEVPELDVAGRGAGVTLPVLSSANENRRTCEACRCERAGCSLLRTAPPDAYREPRRSRRRASVRAPELR